MEGLFNKYKIEKADGSPVDPNAIYFVLRLDTDVAAREAAIFYATLIQNEQLNDDLINLFNKLEKEQPK